MAEIRYLAVCEIAHQDEVGEREGEVDLLSGAIIGEQHDTVGLDLHRLKFAKVHIAPSRIRGQSNSRSGEVRDSMTLMAPLRRCSFASLLILPSVVPNGARYRSDEEER